MACYYFNGDYEQNEPELVVNCKIGHLKVTKIVLNDIKWK